METPFTILVVDDDRAILNIFEYGLKERGYEVHTAGNAADAEKLTRAIRIDCMLADIKLPDRDGISLTAEIHTRQPDLITILMTGYPGIKSAIQGLRENVQDYLIKPFSVEQVVASIERARKLQDLQRQNHARQARIEELEAALDEARRQIAALETLHGSLSSGSLGARRKGMGAGELARKSYERQQGENGSPGLDTAEELD